MDSTLSIYQQPLAKIKTVASATPVNNGLSMKNVHSPLIIAHRGSSDVAPENTLVAFRRAVFDGADGVECDVRLAKDDVPVLFHDATLKRTASINEKIAEMTSCELAQVDVGSWFNYRNRGHARIDYEAETVPRLADLFETMREQPDKLIYIELKCDANERHMARQVALLIEKFNFQSRVVVKSFELDALVEIKKYFPDICIAALFKPHPMRLLHPKRNLIKPALQLEAEEISLHYTLATGRALRKAHAANLKTVIWTADNPSWVKRALQIGIHGIITNNPARLIARREELL